MNRKDFFKHSCKLGACGCAGLALFTSNQLFAGSGEEEKPKPDWRIGFMQTRFAKLIENMKTTLDNETKKQLLENLGRACAEEEKEKFAKYYGNVKEFLKDIETKWVEKTVFDEGKNEIKIFDKKREKCFCPFVDMEKMTDDFCNCSIGWQKQTYENIIGKPVDVKIESSILRGGERCSFTITF